MKMVWNVLLDLLIGIRIGTINVSLMCFSALSGIPFSLGMFFLLFKSVSGEFLSHFGVE